MSNELLHPPAEVVRTGLPAYSSTASERKLVAGPFASGPPSTSAIPPGAWTPPQLRSASREAVIVDVPETPASVVDELEYEALASVRGGRRPRKKAILWEVIRSLRLPSGEPGDMGDLPLLSTSLPSPRQTLTQIRHSHHQLAQMLATGTKQEECSHIIGYSPAYISTLKGDPTFQELIAYYSSQRELTFVDAIERMRTLGLNTLEELQARLEEDPSAFTNRELMEQAELMLIKPMAATRGIIPLGGARAGDGSGSGVQVNVNFIQNTPRGDTPVQPDIIDMKPTRVS